MYASPGQRWGPSAAPAARPRQREDESRDIHYQCDPARPFPSLLLLLLATRLTRLRATCLAAFQHTN